MAYTSQSNHKMTIAWNRIDDYIISVKRPQTMDNKKKSDLKKSCTYQEEYATGVLVQLTYNPME